MTTFVLKYSRHLSINYHVLQFERNFVDLQYSLEQITSYLKGLILSIWIYKCKHAHTHMCVCAESLQSCPALCGHMVCSFCPWDSPGENTGVGCHFLFHICAKVFAKGIEGFSPKSQISRTQSLLLVNTKHDSIYFFRVCSDVIVPFPKAKIIQVRERKLC